VGIDDHVRGVRPAVDDDMAEGVGFNSHIPTSQPFNLNLADSAEPVVPPHLVGALLSKKGASTFERLFLPAKAVFGRPCRSPSRDAISEV
jgi:hypothetical protein